MYKVYFTDDKGKVDNVWVMDHALLNFIAEVETVLMWVLVKPKHRRAA